MALWSRKPAKGLIWHTDRGSQYASDSHRTLLKDHGIIQSMSRKGNCWDNAVSESFFHSLKTELAHHYQFKTREEAKQTIFDYIEVFYNRQRLHSANGYLSPVVICRQWCTKRVSKQLNNVSGKVLTHQPGKAQYFATEINDYNPILY